MKERSFYGKVRIGADDDSRGAITEQRPSDHAVKVGPRRSAEVHDGDLGADGEDTSTAIVLGEVLGMAKDGGAGEATLLVEHGAADRGVEAEKLGELVVGAEHVDAAGGAEDEMGDVGLGSPPLLDGLGCSFFG